MSFAIVRAFNFTVRRLDEAVVVDAGVSRKRGDQTDVRTFWSFNWADTTVVRRVNVSNFETSAVASQTTGPESRQGDACA